MTAMWITRVLAPLGLLTALTAEALIVLVDVESVLVTGPLMVALGLLILIPAGLSMNWFALGFGVSMVMVSVLFFGLVLALDWNPSDAEMPFAIMGAVYCFLMAPVASIAVVCRPGCTRYAPGECRRCGYLLYGLPDPRCPECGTPFDPRTVPAKPVA